LLNLATAMMLVRAWATGSWRWAIRWGREVIGVNTAILSPNGGSIGIGFAMSSAVVTNVVDQLIEFGETRRGWLGVRIQDVTPDMVDAIKI